MKSIDKKSQMEVFGLAIVMVVLVFSFLIILRLGMGANKAPVNIKESAKKNMIAGSFVDALLRTTTDCSDYSVEDLLDDALSYDKGNRLIECSSYPNNPQDSMDYVSSFINKSLKYFDDKGEYYLFTVSKNGDKSDNEVDDLRFTSSAGIVCKSQNYESFPTKIQTFTGENILITLKICLG